MNQVSEAPGAPGAVGPYALAREAGGMVFLSGSVGLDPATGELAGDGLAEQAERALDNMAAVLAACGLKWRDLVKTTVFLTDMNDFAEFNEIYARRFAGSEALPARSCVAVAALPRGARVEVEAVAWRGPEK